MSALAKVFVTIGLLSLFHAAYSAQEFSAVATKLHLSTDLPLDIKLETVFAVVLACFGVILGSETLKPIAWSVWAGNVEKEGGAANPFRMFDERPSFVDIRAKRKEFAEWARNGGSARS